MRTTRASRRLAALPPVGSVSVWPALALRTFSECASRRCSPEDNENRYAHNRPHHAQRKQKSSTQDVGHPSSPRLRSSSPPVVIHSPALSAVTIPPWTRLPIRRIRTAIVPETNAITLNRRTKFARLSAAATCGSNKRTLHRGLRADSSSTSATIVRHRRQPPRRDQPAAGLLRVTPCV